MNQLELTNNQFLTNKEWWIEEKDNKYFLFVKHNGKVYQSSVDKERIDYAKSSGGKVGKTLREGWTTLLINDIERKIILDEISI